MRTLLVGKPLWVVSRGRGASEAVGPRQPIGLEAGLRLDWAVTVGPWSLA